MNDVLFLKPAFQTKMWGGQKLRTDFHYDIPSDTTGECWAISAHPHRPATIANGDFSGLTLAELWDQQPKLFGNPSGHVFPLLTKILDAAKILSVQVHPDDQYAQEHEHELGKTECWYVLSAEPGSYLIYGHNARDKAELKGLVNQGQWDQLLRKVYVKTGDFFFVPSGTLHAIGSGVVVLETQQSSDTTYRFYDFDRVDPATGKTRELHLQQSIDCTETPFVDQNQTPITTEYDHASITQLVDSTHFIVNKWQTNFGHLTLHHEVAPYTLASVVDGQGKLKINDQVYSITKGDHFIIPATTDEWPLDGNMTVIASEPK